LQYHARKGEAVKKIVVLFVLYIAAAVHITAEMPQSGEWYFEVIGTSDTINVAINGAEWSFDMGTGVTAKQNVTVDRNKKTIIIPIFTVLSDYFVYNDTESTVDFYAGGNFNFNFYDLMAESMEELKHYNSVSNDFVAVVLEELKNIFLKAPILRLRKYI
jgi:hypothetical protein